MKFNILAALVAFALSGAVSAENRAVGQYGIGANDNPSSFGVNAEYDFFAVDSVEFFVNGGIQNFTGNNADANASYTAGVGAQFPLSFDDRYLLKVQYNYSWLSGTENVDSGQASFVFDGDLWRFSAQSAYGKDWFNGVTAERAIGAGFAGGVGSFWRNSEYAQTSLFVSYTF